MAMRHWETESNEFILTEKAGIATILLLKSETVYQPPWKDKREKQGSSKA